MKKGNNAMRIAIVDDIASARTILRNRLKTQLCRCALYAEIREFESGEAFLSAAKQEHFELVFLDVYMDRKNGVETAKDLRQFNSDCILVFTTTSMDHALDAFRVRALQYLVKPYTDEELAVLFDEIMQQLPSLDKYIDVNTVGGVTRLHFREILYAEHYQHQIHIYTADGRTTVTRQTFREFTEKLNDECFFLCRRGIVINLEYAADFDGTDFILKNGKKLPVTRELSQAANLAFGDFLFKRGARP